MMSRGTYLRSTVSFLASSSQLRWRVLNLDAARLSVPAATGGNALINTDCPSQSTCWSVSLTILGGPWPLPHSPRSQLINVWVTVLFPYWYLDWWRRCGNKPYWPAGEGPTCLRSSMGKRWFLHMWRQKIASCSGEIFCYDCVALGQQFISKESMMVFYMHFFLVNTFEGYPH